MTYQKLSQPIHFLGSLKANRSEAPLTFQAYINPYGKIEIDFDKIIVNTRNIFIQDCLWSFGEFSLTGKAEDGTELSIESLSLDNSEVDLDKNIISLRVSRCPKIRFVRKLDRPREAVLRWLNGFRSDPTRPLVQECQLGTIILGECQFNDSNEITGFIKIEINEEQLGFSDWHEQANKLLDHIMGVMSFAIGMRIKTPIIENYASNDLEIMVLSQAGNNSVSGIPVFSYIDRQSIFNTAVASFFNPPFPVKNLLSTIEWFVMDSSIYEVRLIHAFTALENIIASNLEESENGTLFLPPVKFEKLIQGIKKVLKKWLIDNTCMEGQERGKIYAKLKDVNRRSLGENLNTLANRWSVSLEGISKENIAAAINVRNSIIHTGSYNDESDSNIKISHFWVIREIVIRFIFTAIGYQGNYISHLGNFHTSQYPPKIL
ncbi:MAG: hypothetical protein PHR16_10520 [Methylovulum sp.]|nr:hypothetical protein [Methylovulum sp.]